VSRVLRADATPRTDAEGAFAHLDVRWMVGEHTGAELVTFGQTTYPSGATHEKHYHPNAEEVVLVTSGRGDQVVGDETLAVGPGDVCFIPRGVPHRITAVSDDDLVIYWVLGGAAGLEAAGYVPVAD
jgi:quercetin dioxygenase-like cupin family protein